MKNTYYRDLIILNYNGTIKHLMNGSEEDICVDFNIGFDYNGYDNFISELNMGYALREYKYVKIKHLKDFKEGECFYIGIEETKEIFDLISEGWMFANVTNYHLVRCGEK